MLQPEHCAQPRDYANRIMAPSRQVFLAGQTVFRQSDAVERYYIKLAG
jgi:hypothetical protein